MLPKEKGKVVTEIRERIKDSRLIILTTFSGLDVEKITNIRSSLREVGGRYQVVKNTLIKRAARETVLESMEKYFQGPLAVIFSDGDPIKPCKVLREFTKDHTQVEIKGGILDNKVISLDEIKELAVLPTREILLVQFLSLLKSPHQKIVRVLGGVPQKLVRVLDLIRQKKES
ncbi:MAG: 50S ribosomal protein L10 [Proteobacteria bacterium]|nr:50S ribosomal protein L10 [Pseudomonadota bacterium]